MSLQTDVEMAATAGKQIDAARALADAGRTFNKELAKELRRDFAVPATKGMDLFLPCAVKSCEWAGFVGQDPYWFADGCRYFTSHVAPRRKYIPGPHYYANPIANLTTWLTIMDAPKNLLPPTARSSAKELIQFAQDTLAALKLAEWRGDRSWLAAWTFFGAFKVYLVYRTDLWTAPGIDGIILPSGGKANGGSFEGGWSILNDLGLVKDPPAAGERFDEGLVRMTQLHAEVVRLASVAGSTALHVNSGIYKLGSPA